MSNLWSSLVRTSGFFTKEILGILRQPRLVVSLVLGPFLILLLFGLGFRGQTPELRTVLVVPKESGFEADADLYQDAFGGVFRLQEVTFDEARARAMLADGQTDVVAIIPPDAGERIVNGTPAALPVLYTETDPAQSAWVRYFAYVQATELNRRILAEVIRQSRGPAALAVDYSDQFESEVTPLEADLEAGSLASARARTTRLLGLVRQAREGVARSLDAIGGAAAAGSGGQVTRLLDAMESELVGIETDLSRGQAGVADARGRARTIRQHNTRFTQLAEQANRIPPETLVSPFEAAATNVVPVEPTPIGYYTPAVLALLLQHIGVSLSSLSGVRDRLLGTVEIFRVSPVSSASILVGKSLGYALLLAVVAVALSLAATTLLGVPSLGSPLLYWSAIALTIFGSLGLGFALGGVARSESQAVQLSMLVLLTSVFFGGFFLPLEQLFPWVRSVSYVLPVTYGALDLRDVMLRGVTPPWPFLVAPFLLGVGFFLLGLLGLSRQMHRAA